MFAVVVVFEILSPIQYFVPGRSISFWCFVASAGNLLRVGPFDCIGIIGSFSIYRALKKKFVSPSRGSPFQSQGEKIPKSSNFFLLSNGSRVIVIAYMFVIPTMFASSCHRNLPMQNIRGLSPWPKIKMTRDMMYLAQRHGLVPWERCRFQ